MNQSKIRSVLFLTLGIFVVLFFHFIPVGFDDGGYIKRHETKVTTSSLADSKLNAKSFGRIKF